MRGSAVDVTRPPPDDLKVCGQQKTRRWPLGSALTRGPGGGGFVRRRRAGGGGSAGGGPRRRMAAFVRGLLAGLPRVNCWSIPEHAGEGGPRGMQRLLSAAVWDEAGMRDDLRGYVLEHFGDRGAVLVVDETGDVKR